MKYREMLLTTIVEMLKGGDVTFIDCANCIDQYMLPKITRGLYVARIEVVFDLVDMLKRLKPRRLLLSPYRHLLLDLRDDEADDTIKRIDSQLLRLSEEKEVGVIEWDIRYHRRGR